MPSSSKLHPLSPGIEESTLNLVDQAPIPDKGTDKEVEGSKPTVMTPAYEAAGVSLFAQDLAIEGFMPSVKPSHAAVQAKGIGEVLQGVGAFGGAFQPNLRNCREPVLVSSTDGLGTKTLLHALFQSWELAGRDLVGTVINDILCSGSKPLFMLDYIGWHGLEEEVLAQIVTGVALGCTEIDCALIGGELAEMRDVYKHGDFDLTGTAVGLADKSKMLGAHLVKDNSVLIGLASTGVHANGFSLVRKALDNLNQEDWLKPIETPRGSEPLWQALIAPTRCYAGAMTALREAGVELQAAAHISGGGLVDNLPRVVPEGLCVRVDRAQVPEQAVFATIQQRGQVSAEEMWHVFNMGCGFVLICAPEQAQAARPILEAAGFAAFELGTVEAAASGARFAWAD